MNNVNYADTNHYHYHLHNRFIGNDTFFKKFIWGSKPPQPHQKLTGRNTAISVIAAIEINPIKCFTEFPPVTVIIADGKENEDLTIKVSDEGGGIPRSHVKRIWSYLFTTADPVVQEASLFASEDHSIDSPLAGLGYGLPISRSYARYFGGDLSIMSMEGHGTDAFVHLRRLG